jgi:hypothetical protein
MATSEEITAQRLKISEAETALHRLMLGDKEVRVTFGQSRSTQWNEAKIPDLRRYINELKDQLAAMEGRRGRGPIYPVPFPR